VQTDGLPMQHQPKTWPWNWSV